MERNLPWPGEQAITVTDEPRLHQPASNICLDFHGDPLHAGLTVFSDGNHHMALQATAELFVQQYPEVIDVFYATTPPNILVSALETGAVNVGNLRLSRQPDFFISPLPVMEQLREKGFVDDFRPFMQSRGNVLLIRKHNPKSIADITDLLRDDVRLFTSNPEKETASFEVYYQTMVGLLQEKGIDRQALDTKLASPVPATVVGDRIHHREAPQALFADRADVAMVYYHLALRYTRIFPDDFGFIPLGGTRSAPQPPPANITTTYYAGLINQGGQWGARFLDFLYSDEVTDIYASHGLSRPAANVT